MSKRARKKDAAKRKGDLDTAPTASARKQGAGSKASWKVLDRTSTIAGGLLAREVAQTLWRVSTGKKAPVNSRSPEVETREAVAWAIIGGASIELVKVLVRRYAAQYWVRSTGELPPGMRRKKKATTSAQR